MFMHCVMRLLCYTVMRTVGNLRSMMCHFALRAPRRKSCFELAAPDAKYRIAFAGAKFAESPLRAPGHPFRGARTHEEATRYRYSASGNFRGYIFAEAAKTEPR